MAKQTKLPVRRRQESGSTGVKQVRDRGAVPAVVYGSKQEPLSVEVAKRTIENLLAHAAGESLLVELEIEGDTEPATRLALIQEVQHHPVRGDVLHIDFHAVSATETIEAEIPVEPVGEADGVKNFGGILEQILRALPIRCLPQNLPEIIHVDVAPLKVGDTIHVRDLVLPEGVEAAIDGEVTVLAIAEPNVAAASEEPGETPAAPEVIKEKTASDESSAPAKA